MDIEEFYDGDRRRKDGEDYSYGMSWSDATRPGLLFDLYWNDGSSELYLMSKPVAEPLIGWVGVSLVDDWRELENIEHRIVTEVENLIHPGHIRAKTGQESPWYIKDALTEELMVEILGRVESKEEVDRILEGWQQAMTEHDSVSWLRGRLTDQEVQA
jgi:hypothetical protein